MSPHPITRLPQPHGGTCGVGGLKALLLDGVIRDEFEEHPVARGEEGFGLFGPAEAAEHRGFGVPAVVDLEVVVGAFLLRLHVQLREGLWRGWSVGRGRGDPPLLPTPPGAPPSLPA